MPATYKLTLYSFLESPFNPYLNVFGYHDQLALPVDGSNLAPHFISDVLPDIQAVVHHYTTFTRVDVEEVIGGSGFWSVTLPGGTLGARTGERMPEFVAWGFRYNRDAVGVRSGAKRFGSVAEGDVQDGSATSGIITDLNTLADRLGAAIQVGLVDTWFPVILERPVTVGGPWNYHGLSGVSYQGVTTQNTRKR